MKSSIKIDTTTQPFVPRGWSVESHDTSMGIIEWPITVKLYLSKKQMGSRYILGNDLRRELANQPVLNANVLDALYEHPELIPDDWKVDEQGRTRYIYFWGTIYRYSDDNLCVRFLYFSDGAWCRDYAWLGRGWDAQDSAALASTLSPVPKSSLTLSSLSARISALEKKFEKLKTL